MRHSRYGAGAYQVSARIRMPKRPGLNPAFFFFRYRASGRTGLPAGYIEGNAK